MTLARRGLVRRIWNALNTALEIAADISGVGFTSRRTGRRDTANDPRPEEQR
jgi:hypothetical protein